MKLVTVTWQPERDAFVAHGARPDRPITMNAPHDGEASGISPAETLLAAVGGCTAWDVVEILRKGRQQLRGVEVRIAGEQAADPPHHYTHVLVTYVVTGRGLDPARVERAVELSRDRYCSVIGTIRGVAAVDTAIEIVEESPADPALASAARD